MNHAVYDIISSVKVLTGLGVCFYDKNLFFSSRYGMLQKAFRGHYCPYCDAMKSLPGGQEACDANDGRLVCELAGMYKKPFFNVCHAGVCEYIVPVFREKKLIATLFIGQCRVDDEMTRKRMRDCLSSRSETPEFHEKLYMSLPETTREILSSAGKLADGCLRELSEIQIQSFRSLPEMARHHLDYRYMDDMSLSDLADLLHTNPSYLSRVFRNTYGVTLSEYSANVRVTQAKKLLQFTNIPVTNISFNVGFSDPNYFSRVFRKATGLTPSEYRKKYREAQKNTAE